MTTRQVVKCSPCDHLCDVCFWRKRAEIAAAALKTAEAALSDIGDADREPGDDLAWCEARAAQDLPAVRAALAGMPLDAPE